EDLVGGVHLDIGQQHGQLRRDVVAELPIGQFVRVRQELDSAVEVGVLLQVAEHPPVGARHRFGLSAGLAEEREQVLHSFSDQVADRVLSNNYSQNVVLGGEGTLVQQG